METPSETGRILVIALGGTISLELTDNRALATDNMHSLVSGMGSNLDVCSFAAKNGSDITLQDIVSIGKLILEHAGSYSAFIVTTGTDTLEEVAYGLSLLLDDLTMVVVTGAMRPPFATDFDGIRSLTMAVQVCQKATSGQASVVVSIGGSVIPAWLAHKRSTSRLDAFVSTMPDPTDAQANKRSDLPTSLGMALLKHPALPSVDIPIVGFSVGSGLQVARFAGADGLVVSCPGACSVATETRAALVRDLLSIMPVVLTSRCEDSHGDVSACYPGHFDELEALGFKVRGYLGLSAEKARIKLAFEVLSGRNGWAESQNH
ncbi:asparaginase domain-containing protein [Roseobacter sinensis]|uniref:Asparaginase domain-containing protein n=1 Tax=Roseobacter sinensis TaxID=2931391 RepID=A0ABT3BM88_9RHOB|nr:asparaginase domain-containing protein [Roseobacter sp. WL0113]MCV3274379.1 asparaginase domain-containing protein [Roseobacter sp. WL0113]